MTNTTPNAEFNILEGDKVFELIISANDELKEAFERYLVDEYTEADQSRLYYIDISQISRFIVNRVKSKQTDFLKELFIKIEQILSDCDKQVENLIVVGLFEGIQNTGGREIDYYPGYDTCLLPLSKTKWDGLIDLWEGTNWRGRK